MGCCDITNHEDNSRRRVSFGSIYVRQYERIVGDNPSTTVGVPVSIGWAYYEDEEQYINPVSLDRYEMNRRINNLKRGRNRKQLRMTSITRENMLLNVFGVPKKELIEAEKEIKKIRKQRNRSNNQPMILKQITETNKYKKFGRKLRDRGLSFLKSMSYAANSELMTSSTSGSKITTGGREGEGSMSHLHYAYGF